MLNLGVKGLEAVSRWHSAGNSIIYAIRRDSSANRAKSFGHFLKMAAAERCPTKCGRLRFRRPAYKERPSIQVSKPVCHIPFSDPFLFFVCSQTNRGLCFPRPCGGFIVAICLHERFPDPISFRWNVLLPRNLPLSLP